MMLDRWKKWKQAIKIWQVENLSLTFSDYVDLLFLVLNMWSLFGQFLMMPFKRTAHQEAFEMRTPGLCESTTTWRPILNSIYVKSLEDSLSSFYRPFCTVYFSHRLNRSGFNSGTFFFLIEKISSFVPRGYNKVECSNYAGSWYLYKLEHIWGKHSVNLIKVFLCCQVNQRKMIFTYSKLGNNNHQLSTVLNKDKQMKKHRRRMFGNCTLEPSILTANSISGDNLMDLCDISKGCPFYSYFRNCFSWVVLGLKHRLGAVG